MKRIIFIINSLEIGGTEKQFLKLIKLIRNKYHISIFSFSSGELTEQFLKFKISLQTCNYKFFQIFKLFFFFIKK